MRQEEIDDIKCGDHKEEDPPALDSKISEYKNEGYRAQAAGQDFIRDNPHPSPGNGDISDPHWLWRRGFIEAKMDSDPGYRLYR